MVEAKKKKRKRKSKGVYKCDLCVEGSPLLARGSPDQNTNRLRAWLSKRVMEQFFCPAKIADSC